MSNDLITAENIAIRLYRLNHFWFNGKPTFSIVEIPDSYFKEIVFDFNAPNENDLDEIKRIKYCAKLIDNAAVLKMTQEAVDNFSDIIDEYYKQRESERTARGS